MLNLIYSASRRGSQDKEIERENLVVDGWEVGGRTVLLWMIQMTVKQEWNEQCARSSNGMGEVEENDKSAGRNGSIPLKRRGVYELHKNGYAV